LGRQRIFVGSAFLSAAHFCRQRIFYRCIFYRSRAGLIPFLNPAKSPAWAYHGQVQIATTMSYCLNPDCQKPKNSDRAVVCRNCGSELRLRLRYLPDRPLGQGGFGRTFLAVDEDRPSKPLCVIKQFLPIVNEPRHRKKAADLFAREARQLEDLGSHPQIPTLLAYFAQEEQQYLIQEYIQGQTLAQQLEARRSFSENQVLELLLGLLPLLAFIHERGVIHRDIKPPNIIASPVVELERSGQALSAGEPELAGDPAVQYVLVDFGAAKAGQHPTAAAQHTGTAIGSPEYLAPEQARGKAVFASDLYSLGVTCLQLLTGRSPLDLYDSHEDKWVWQRYLPQPLSVDLVNILQRMLEPSLKQRYTSASEVLQELGALALPPRVAPPSSVLSTSPVGHSHGQPAETPAARRAINLPQFRPDQAIAEDLAEDGDLTIEGPVDPGDGADKTWQPMSRFRSTGRICAVALTPGQPLLLFGSGTAVKRWDLANQQPLRPLTGHFDLVQTLALSPDGTWLVSGGADKTIRLWNLAQGGRGTGITFASHSDTVTALAITPDSRHLISSSVYDPIIIWDLSQRRELHRLSGHTARINSLAISPNGAMLASASSDKTIRLWNLVDGSMIKLLDDHTHPVSALAFSPDGKTLVSGSWDGNLIFWSSQTLRMKKLVDLGDSRIQDLAFTPDGKALVVASDTLQLWNWRLAKQIAVLARPAQDSGPVGQAPSFCAIATCGGAQHWLASASTHGLIQVWKAG
jgi:serine/threonine protein kinase